MILWFVLTVATSVATVVVVMPLILRLERARAANSLAVAVSRDQLREFEQDVSGGANRPSEPAQTVAAGGGIQRPVVAADRAEGLARPQFSPWGRVVAIAATVVLGLVGVYAFTSGSERNAALPDNFAAGASASASAAPQAPVVSGGDRKSPAGLPSVEELTQRLVMRLQQNPRDPEGWRLLGLSYSNIGRHADAAAAFARAIEQNPTNADIRGARVEALVKAAGGQVTPEATTALEEGLRLAPGNPELRYFKGLSMEQAGDKKAAYALWSEILKEDDPKDPWADDLRQHVKSVGQELGIVSSTPNSSQGPQAEAGTPAAMLEFLQSREPSGSSPRPAPGIAAGPANSAGAPAPADNSAMIRGMVESLASRLEQSPNDVDGWIKLMRSRAVLGEQPLAKQALERALRAAGDDPQAREKVMATAEQLGIR